MKKPLFIILLFFFIGLYSHLYASDVLVVVLDFSGTNVTAHQAENARNRILLRLINDTSVNVIEPAKKITSITGPETSAGYEKGNSRAAEIGRGNNADYVVYGTLDRLKEQGVYILYVRVVNSFTGSVVYAESQEFKQSREVMGAADILAHRLIGKLKSFRPARYSAKKVQFYIDVYCSYVQPVGNLTDYLFMGGSFTAVIGTNINEFLLGFRTGCHVLDGSHDNNFSVIVPMQINFGYSFTVYSSFFIALAASGGLVFQYLETNDDSFHGFSPIVGISVTPGYSFSKHIGLIFPIDSSCIIEGKKDLWSLSAGVGVQYRY